MSDDMKDNSAAKLLREMLLDEIRKFLATATELPTGPDAFLDLMLMMLTIDSSMSRISELYTRARNLLKETYKKEETKK